MRAAAKFRHAARKRPEEWRLGKTIALLASRRLIFQPDGTDDCVLPSRYLFTHSRLGGIQTFSREQPAH